MGTGVGRGHRGTSVVTAIIVAIGLLGLGSCSSGSTGKGASGAGAPAQVTVVTQNLLHGEACPAATDLCHIADRVQLFVTQLGRSCPDLVAVEEANRHMVSLLRAAAAHVCGGHYRVAWDDDPGLDREVVLSTSPILVQQRFRLPGPLRTTLWVRVAAKVGVVDLWATHLASGSDDRPCDRTTCPPPCQVSDQLGACQSRQLLALAQARRAPDDVLVVAGDFNAHPTEPGAVAMTKAGLIDTTLAAGNPECTKVNPADCTSGRDDTGMVDMTGTTNKQYERIDYVFLGARAGCRTASPTGLFAAAPETGGPAGLTHPSDHTGVVATISCPTTDAERAAAPSATLPATTTTSSVAPVLGSADQAAIGAAFTGVFGGGSGIDTRLANVEDAGVLHQVVVDGYERTKSIADRINVRIDKITLVDTTHADVTFTLLLDGTAVLDSLPGHAVKMSGHWLVSRRTFCDVGTQGATTIPAPCR